MILGICIICTFLAEFTFAKHDFTQSKATRVSPLNFEVLVAAIFSPFDENYQLDTSVVSCQAKYLNSTGVSWIFVSGTTGESVSLSLNERKSLIDSLVNIAPTFDMNVIVMVGSNVCVMRVAFCFCFFFCCY